MKHKLLTIVMIIAGLTLPLQINAKGKPAIIDVALLKDANGETVGRVIGMEHVSRPYVLTDQGYRTEIPLPWGMVVTSPDVPIYYESIDCTGTAYVEHFRYIGAVFIPRVHSEIAYNAGIILYTPHDAQLVTINVNSTLDTGDFYNINCSPFVVTRDAYPTYLNDPAVTGIQNTAYPTPMVIE